MVWSRVACTGVFGPGLSFDVAGPVLGIVMCDDVPGGTYDLRADLPFFCLDKSRSGTPLTITNLSRPVDSSLHAFKDDVALSNCLLLTRNGSIGFLSFVFASLKPMTTQYPTKMSAGRTNCCVSLVASVIATLAQAYFGQLDRQSSCPKLPRPLTTSLPSAIIASSFGSPPKNRLTSVTAFELGSCLSCFFVLYMTRKALVPSSSSSLVWSSRRSSEGSIRSVVIMALHDFFACSCGRGIPVSPLACTIQTGS